MTLYVRELGAARTARDRSGLRARLELVAQGRPNATIAAMLGIGERAVELHMTALLHRFGVANRASLVACVWTQPS